MQLLNGYAQLLNGFNTLEIRYLNFGELMLLKVVLKYLNFPMKNNRNNQKQYLNL